jgi:hypothetical protein
MNEDLLARAAIRHGITPLFLEQAALPMIKKKLADCRFPPEAMTTLFERWDIDGARRKNKWLKAKQAAAERQAVPS